MIRNALPSGVLVVASGLASVIPVALTVMSVHLMAVDMASVFALALTFAGYAAQLLGAYFFEAPLASSDGSKLGLPRGVFLIGALLGTALWVLGYWNQACLFVGAVVLLGLLECTRCVSIARNSWVVELFAALLVCASLSLTIAYMAAMFWFVLPGVLCVIVLMRIGASPNTSLRPSARRVWGWVVLETAVLGATPPLLLIMVLAVLGPASVVEMRLVQSVLAVFSPVLGFLRIRLLRRHSSSETVLSASLVAMLIGVVVVAHAMGLIDKLFNGVAVSHFVLFFCLGATAKVVSIFSTVAFANLRRNGLVRSVFVIRAFSAGILLASCLIGALCTGSLIGVFVAVLAAEVVSCLIYWSRSRRLLGSVLLSRPAVSASQTWSG